MTECSVIVEFVKRRNEQNALGCIRLSTWFNLTSVGPSNRTALRHIIELLVTEQTTAILFDRKLGRFKSI